MFEQFGGFFLFFFVPKLNVIFSDNIPCNACSFTTECCAILSVHKCIESLNYKSFLIVSDARSVLLAINSISFDSSTSPLIFLIESVLLDFLLRNIKAEFLWIPSRVGILGNEMAYIVAKSTSKICRCPIKKNSGYRFSLSFQIET